MNYEARTGNNLCETNPSVDRKSLICIEKRIPFSSTCRGPTQNRCSNNPIPAQPERLKVFSVLGASLLSPVAALPRIPLEVEG